jgi:hypothetical protein
MPKFDKLEAFDTFHWKMIEGAQTAGRYDMPVLKPCADVDISNLVPFHMATSAKDPADSWFHFFVDDYRFERFWNRPANYLKTLEKFKGGISPDFSMYIDMPKAQQVWNCWRNRATAFFLQSKMDNIIPNACWGDEESLDWAFDGLPENSVLAITTQGCLKATDECKHVLVNGLHRLGRTKHPTKLYVYGGFPEKWKDRFSFPIVTLKTFSQEKWGCR